MPKCWLWQQNLHQIHFWSWNLSCLTALESLKKTKRIHVTCRLCAWKVCLQIPFRDFWIETVRWKGEYGHMCLTVCAPCWLRQRCRADALALQCECAAASATAGTGQAIHSVLHSFVTENSTVISKLWTLTKNKGQLCKYTNKHIFLSVYGCNRSYKLNPYRQISIFYCACVWAPLLSPICS